MPEKRFVQVILEVESTASIRDLSRAYKWNYMQSVRTKVIKAEASIMKSERGRPGRPSRVQNYEQS